VHVRLPKAKPTHAYQEQKKQLYANLLRKEMVHNTKEEGDSYLKEWERVQVGHRKNIGKTIEEWQKNGWRVHTYQATGQASLVYHYMLFERGE